MLKRDFSKGMYEGHLSVSADSDEGAIREIKNMEVVENGVLESLPSPQEIGKLYKNDKILPFIYNSKRYYLIYDSLQWRRMDVANAANDVYRKNGVTFGVHDDSLASFTINNDIRSFLAGTHPWSEPVTFDGPTFRTDAFDQVDYGVHETNTELPDPVDFGGGRGDWWANSYNTLKKTLYTVLDRDQIPYYDEDDSSDFHIHPNPDNNLVPPAYLIGYPYKNNPFWWLRVYVADEDFKPVTNIVRLNTTLEMRAKAEILKESDYMDVNYNNAREIRESSFGNNDYKYEAASDGKEVILFDPQGFLVPLVFDGGQTLDQYGLSRRYSEILPYADTVPETGVTFGRAPSTKETETPNKQTLFVGIDNFKTKQLTRKTEPYETRVLLKGSDASTTLEGITYAQSRGINSLQFLAESTPAPYPVFNGSPLISYFTNKPTLTSISSRDQGVTAEGDGAFMTFYGQGEPINVLEGTSEGREIGLWAIIAQSRIKDLSLAPYFPFVRGHANTKDKLAFRAENYNRRNEVVNPMSGVGASENYLPVYIGRTLESDARKNFGVESLDFNDNGGFVKFSEVKQNDLSKIGYEHVHGSQEIGEGTPAAGIFGPDLFRWRNPIMHPGSTSGDFPGFGVVDSALMAYGPGSRPYAYEVTEKDKIYRGAYSKDKMLLFKLKAKDSGIEREVTDGFTKNLNFSGESIIHDIEVRISEVLMSTSEGILALARTDMSVPQLYTSSGGGASVFSSVGVIMSTASDGKGIRSYIPDRQTTHVTETLVSRRIVTDGIQYLGKSKDKKRFLIKSNGKFYLCRLIGKFIAFSIVDVYDQSKYVSFVGNHILSVQEDGTVYVMNGKGDRDIGSEVTFRGPYDDSVRVDEPPSDVARNIIVYADTTHEAKIKTRTNVLPVGANRGGLTLDCQEFPYKVIFEGDTKFYAFSYKNK